jgi:DNA-binding NarL/FixJ family response regulator
MPANIIQSIISLVNDGGYLSGHASKVLIQLLNRQQPTNTAHRTDQNSGTSSPSSVTMTKKEHEVLNNIQTGLPAKVIADRMGISIFTVNQHLRSIYQKLNARNKMEAVQSAREKGLL